MTIDLSQRIDFEYGVPRELAPGVARIVCNNPGPFTFKGTNTYIVGTRSLAVIDPGPDDAAHCAAIVAAVAGRPVSHIVLTHTHHDHFGGLPRLAAEIRATIAGYGREAPAGARRSGAADGTETNDRCFRPDIGPQPLEEADGLLRGMAGVVELAVGEVVGQ